jgi:dissimilatory sulfite reductase (desulfoviridin) alpha/beta subunit
LFTEDKDPDKLPFNEEDEFTLELDLPPGEEAMASRPLIPQKTKDATLTLAVPGSPMGANIQADSGLEPLLAQADSLETMVEMAKAPPFYARLSQGLNPEGKPKIKVSKEGPLTWSLTTADLYPVYVRRNVLMSPQKAADLKVIALASKHYASNRVALSPYGDLDLFFNDRVSLEKAQEMLGELGRELKGVPAAITRCRGLLFCPYAALSTFEVERDLVRALRGKKFQPGAALVKVSIHGCPSGGTLNCGVLNFTDFRLVAKRRAIPTIDYKILKLSPHLEKLIHECPGEALSHSSDPELLLNLDSTKCTSCGLCLSLDPSFHFKGPQEGYLTLECSGRRKLLKDNCFKEPRVLLDNISQNRAEIFAKLTKLIELWHKERRPDELVYEYLERKDAWDFFRL